MLCVCVCVLCTPSVPCSVPTPGGARSKLIKSLHKVTRKGKEKAKKGQRKGNERATKGQRKGNERATKRQRKGKQVDVKICSSCSWGGGKKDVCLPARPDLNKLSRAPGDWIALNDHFVSE
ncbi:hypothetical protein ACMFMG_011042 [Clarireedia jacksonii]